MRTKILFVLTILLLVAGGATAQNSIQVNAAAAMGPDNGGTACGGGMCGLDVVFPGGSTSPARVQDDTPNNETVYRAVFWFDPTNLAPNPSTAGYYHNFLRTTQTDGTFAAAFQLLLTQKTDLYRLSGRALTNNPPNSRYTHRIDLTGANKIQVTWTQSPAPGIPGGHLVIEVLEGPEAGQCVSVVKLTGTGINNSTLDVDNVMLGAVGTISPQIIGNMYLDEFESFRTLGPNGDACP